MLTLNLGRIIHDRGITDPYAFLKKAGFTYHTAGNLLRNSNSSIRYDHLEKLCLVLNCTINDLFEWRPAAGTTHTDTHPLAQLKPRPTSDLDIHHSIRTLPLDKLGELHAFINKLGDEDHPGTI